ncbi:MAG: XRE family transcriptional regulator [Bacteroidetes bacterium]|nr:MAG: XRE family transcriptional regulator [Bacteroidota bacterium]
MKMRIGTRLLALREDRKMSQAEMADLLGVSAPTYSRLERNETSVDLEQIVHYSKILKVPVQEFLPETITINGSNHNGNIGLVIGTVNSYSDKDSQLQIEKLQLLLTAKDEKIAFLETRIKDLEELLAFYKQK